jgi:multidrug efflux pump subunit AcrA (membrane-fusion protein)
MKRSIIAVILLLAVCSCRQKEKEVHPELKELTAAVYASGTLVPEDEYKVVSSVDGYLVKAFVKEGDSVTKGGQLFTLSSSVRIAQEQSARAIVQKTLPATESNAPVFRELKSRIDLARIRMQQDSLQYARYKALYEQNAISKSSYEKYWLQYQSSLKDLQNLNQQWQQQRLSSDLQLQQAQNQASINTAEAGNGNLKSYIDGKVYELYKKEGDLVSPGQPIALLGGGKMIAKLLVDEDDLENIFTGQQVLLTIDAYPDKVFKAHISRVYPMLNKVEQSFRADATLDDILPVYMYGLNMEANIVTEQKKKVLAIPRAALQKGDSVLVKADGKTRKIKVSTGARDDEWVEVRNGLNTSSTVIIAL